MVADRQSVPHAAGVAEARPDRGGRRPKRLHDALDPDARPDKLPAPWAALAWRQIAPVRNRAKACVYAAEHEGRRVVCKDASRVSRLPGVRLFRHWTLRNEARALTACDGLSGVPRLLGAWRTGLVMEFLDGRLLTELRGTRVPGEVFDRLDALVAGIHARGLAIGDLHRRNILVDSDGRVGIIDFELAQPVGRGPRGALARRLQKLDRFAAARQRRAFGAPLRPEHEALLAQPPAWYSMARRFKRWRKPSRH